MCACVCVHDGPPRRRALLLRKRKTLFSSVSFSSGGGRGFFFAFLPFFFSRESGDLPLVFFAFKTNAFGWWKKKDLPIYPRPRIRALTCHLGCLGGVVLNNRSSSSVCRRSSPRSFWLGGFRRRTFGVGARGSRRRRRRFAFRCGGEKGRKSCFLCRSRRARGGRLLRFLFWSRRLRYTLRRILGKGTVFIPVLVLAILVTIRGFSLFRRRRRYIRTHRHRFLIELNRFKRFFLHRVVFF